MERNKFVSFLGTPPVAATQEAMVFPEGSAKRRPIDTHFIADVAKKASPAVVNITGPCVVTDFFGGEHTIGQGGSGFVVDSKEGLIMTNAHVVANMKKPILIMFHDGRIREAEVLALDTMYDVAVVKTIKTVTDESFPSLEIGSSSLLCPGEFVVSIGSPLNLQNSVSSGIVSCINREILAGLKYIQTDCPINVGNSGGPLLNLDGKVIGVNSMKHGSGENIGFALPIDVAHKIWMELYKKGAVVRPYIGIFMVEYQVPEKVRIEAQLGVKLPDVDQGVLLVQVEPGSPSAKAGLTQGIILEVNGKPVSSTEEVIANIGEVGKKTQMKIFEIKTGKTVMRTLVPVDRASKGNGSVQDAQQKKKRFWQW
eukprot:CAMPEP_0174250620 /NCGR_PEP_ID=MMETSP0439-20130205/744_1 /TAXON_ID=0 /ORGANISM="Stereomyxa ramosa, Strain Chinc5" /LENGTH=367 /DNA_ID=CAMNT_0015330747 /DNA_START=305 /DNA_END=1405 /DNA_ORIENTATION=+